MRAVAGPGRWVWALSGLVTAAVLVLPGARLITLRDGAVTASAEPQAVATRTVIVPQPVTSLTVQDNGGEVQVTAGQVSRVQVTETIMYDHQGDGPPAVAQSVSGGRLSLSDPACAESDCSVDFSLTVPFGVTVSVATQGGPATVSGVAGANLDTGGGPARVSLIGGPLTVSTDGGPLVVRGATGSLRADTGGGTLLAQDVTSTTATVTTGGGPRRSASRRPRNRCRSAPTAARRSWPCPAARTRWPPTAAAARSRWRSPPTRTPVPPSRSAAAAARCGSSQPSYPRPGNRGSRSRCDPAISAGLRGAGTGSRISW